MFRPACLGCCTHPPRDTRKILTVRVGINPHLRLTKTSPEERLKEVQEELEKIVVEMERGPPYRVAGVGAGEGKERGVKVGMSIYVIDQNRVTTAIEDWSIKEKEIATASAFVFGINLSILLEWTSHYSIC